MPHNTCVLLNNAGCGQESGRGHKRGIDKRMGVIIKEGVAITGALICKWALL